MNKKQLTFFIAVLCSLSVKAQQSRGRDSAAPRMGTDSLHAAKLSEEVIVYAYALRGKLSQTAAAVSVLDKNMLQRFEPGSFVSAMNTVPGVKMDERSPGSYRISIRGNLLRSAFGVRNVKVYLDGLPFTDASGNTYFNALAVNSIDQMEIIKGPGGSMYGAGTGGVIMLNNEPAQKNSRVRFLGGSFGLFSAEGKYDFGNKNTNQAISFTHTQSDGYRRQSAMRRDAGIYNFTVNTSEKNKIKGDILYSNLFYQTPGGLTTSELNANPRQARPGAEAQKTAIYLSMIYASLSDEFVINKHWKNTTGAYFTYTDFKNPAIRNFEHTESKGTGGRSVFEFSSGKFSAAAGAEYQYSFINTSTFGNRAGMRDTLQYHDKIPVRQLNIFAQAGTALPFNTQLTAGISYNDFYYDFHRVSTPQQQDQSDFSPQYIPRISLLKKISSVGSAYISYSKGYSPPSIDEIHATNGVFNKNLHAEQGENYEAGLRMRLLKGRLHADISRYIFHLRQTIVSRQDAGGATYYTNAGRTNQEGFEFELSLRAVDRDKYFTRKLNFRAAGTYVHARFADYKQGTANYSGNRLTGTPPFVFSMMADLVTAPGVYTDITYSYTDRIPLNDANTYFAKAYNLLFVKLGWQKIMNRKTAVDLFATMQKSFNKNYSLGNDLNAAANRFFNPASLQVFTAGVALNIKKGKEL